jgi:hypothetical protein
LGELAGGLKIRDGDALAEKRITMTKSIMATSRDTVLAELKATKADDSRVRVEERDSALAKVMGVGEALTQATE